MKPIIFSGPMVRAILDGTKTQTRRVVKPQPDTERDGKPYWYIGGHRLRTGAATPLRCRYGQPGDLLWVKENWAQRLDRDHLNGTQLYESGVREAWYWADGPGKCCNTGCAGAAGRVRAARFMPRWASRLTLRITGVRIERLQEITEEDVEAEGVQCPDCRDVGWINSGPDGGWECGHPLCGESQALFRAFWDSINAKRGHPWDSNPFVWVIEFERAELEGGE